MPRLYQGEIPRQGLHHSCQAGGGGRVGIEYFQDQLKYLESKTLAAQIITGESFNYTPYVVAGLVFVALTIPMTRFTDWVTARMNRRQSQGGAV